MRSIKRFALPLTLLVVFSSGCQFLPTVDEAVETPQGSEAQQQSVVSVNPYTLDQPSVSAAAKQQFSQATEAMAQQQWLEAKQLLLQLNRTHPNLSGPYLNLAIVYTQTEQLDLAEQSYRKALSANANNLDAYNQFAVFLREQGRFEEAEGIYQRALQRWDQHPQTHLNYGILLELYMGKLAEALTHYQRYQALQAEPDRKTTGWIIDLQRRIVETGE